MSQVASPIRGKSAGRRTATFSSRIRAAERFESFAASRPMASRRNLRCTPVSRGHSASTSIRRDRIHSGSMSPTPARWCDTPIRTAISRLPDEPEKLIADIPASGGHSTRDIVFSKDGKSLFLAVGSASNNNDSRGRIPPRQYPGVHAGRQVRGHLCVGHSKSRGPGDSSGNGRVVDLRQRTR